MRRRCCHPGWCWCWLAIVSISLNKCIQDEAWVAWAGAWAWGAPVPDYLCRAACELASCKWKVFMAIILFRSSRLLLRVIICAQL